MNNRPIAISGLSLILAATGAMMLLVALGAIRVMEPGQGGGWMALVFGVMGVLGLALAYGLFALKPWAWPLGITMVVGSALTALLSAINRGTLGGIVISLAPAVFLLGGLFLPDVRRALGREASGNTGK